MLPPRDELVGQDLIKIRQQLGREVGPVADGYSTELILCIVDPRLLPRPSRMITRNIQRVNPDLPLSRSTDLAVSGSPDRAATEGLLVQITLAIWEVRTGEITCNDIHDMIHNFNRLTRRVYLAKKRYGTSTTQPRRSDLRTGILRIP